MLIDFNYIALRYLPLASCGDNHRDSNPTKKEVVVYYAGIDAHSKSSTICVVDRKGRTLGGGTMVTSAEGLRAGLNRWLVRGVVAAVESKWDRALGLRSAQELKVKKVLVVNPGSKSKSARPR
jgi:hypothetical protein